MRLVGNWAGWSEGCCLLDGPDHAVILEAAEAPGMALPGTRRCHLRRAAVPQHSSALCRRADWSSQQPRGYLFLEVSARLAPFAKQQNMEAQLFGSAWWGWEAAAAAWWWWECLSLQSSHCSAAAHDFIRGESHRLTSVICSVMFL